MRGLSDDPLAEAASIAAAARSRLDPDESEATPTHRKAFIAGAGCAVALFVVGFMVLEFRSGPTLAPTPPPPIPQAPQYSKEVTDQVSEVETDFETDDFKKAQADVRQLQAMAPDHPRLQFFKTLIDRGLKTHAVAGRDSPSPTKSGAQRKMTASAAKPEEAAAGSGAREESKGSASPSPSKTSLASTFSGRTIEESAAPRGAGSATPETRTAAASSNAAVAASSTPPSNAAVVAGNSPPSNAAVTGGPSSTEVPPATAALGTAAANASTNNAGTAAVNTETSAAGAPPATNPPTSAAGTASAANAPTSAAAGTAGTASAASAPTSAATGTAGTSGPASTSSPTGDPRRTAHSTVPIVTAEAQLTRRVAPDYPDSAMRKGIQGYVDVQFTITAQGNVTNVAVVSSDPGEVFNRAATDAVRRWRYDPRVVDGQPVDSQSQVRLQFKLNQSLSH
jgi:TonB family protein